MDGRPSLTHAMGDWSPQDAEVEPKGGAGSGLWLPTLALPPVCTAIREPPPPQSWPSLPVVRCAIRHQSLEGQEDIAV